MDEMFDTDRVRHNVARIRAEIAERGGTDVVLIAVTKTHPFEAIFAARDSGCDGVGENYAQELREKMFGADAGIPVHFIGAIQTNKIRLVADVVDVWQSVDRTSVIDELVRRCGSPPRMLLQVNTTGEHSKSGCSPSDIEKLRLAAEGKGATIEGLMTMGPTSQEDSATRAAFAQLRRLTDEQGLSVCSMGMSGDYLVAIDEGSTLLRIGQAIFGERPAR